MKRGGHAGHHEVCAYFTPFLRTSVNVANPSRRNARKGRFGSTRSPFLFFHKIHSPRLRLLSQAAVRLSAAVHLVLHSRAGCSSESASWLASRGRRPLQWTFPLGLLMPISTWKGCSARAPRVAFKQWSFEQPAAGKISQAPKCPQRLGLKPRILSILPLLPLRGVKYLMISGHAISAAAARCAARGTESAACRRASLARRREDHWNLSIDPRMQRTCRVQHARRQLADAGS